MDEYIKLRDQMISSCEICKGTGFLEGDELCNCMKEFRIRHRLLLGSFSSELIAQNIDEVLQQIMFANEKGEAVVQWFLENIQLVDEGGLGIIIYGAHTGIGKTCLATMLAKSYVKYFMREENYKVDMNVKFMGGGEFSDRLMDQFSERYQELLKFWEADLFVLDELGKEMMSTRMFADKTKRVLENFLRHRRRLVKPTIVTTNLTPEEIAGRYGEYVQSLLELDLSGVGGGEVFRGAELIGQDFRVNPIKTLWGV